MRLMKEITRQVFWNVPYKDFFYPLVVFSLILFAIGFLRNVFIWFYGWKDRRQSGDAGSFKDFILNTFLGRRIFKNDLYAGIMHLFILWGFIVLFIGTCLVAIHHYLWHFLKGYAYLSFSLTLDIFGLIFISGIAMAGLRRYFLKRKLLPSGLDDGFVLFLLFLTASTGFLIEGIRLRVQQPLQADWSPAGYFISLFLSADIQNLKIYYGYLWWLHSILSLLFISYIPYSKLFHIFSSFANLYLKSDEINILTISEKRNLTKDYSFRSLLSLDACTLCNRCENVCPSFTIGEPFSPRDIILKTKRLVKEKYGFFSYLAKGNPQKLEEKIKGIGCESWLCTTCRYCIQECPVLINIIEVIRQIRSKEIEAESRVPPSLQEALQAAAKFKNPWGIPKSKRTKWLEAVSDYQVKDFSKNEQAGILYFVGCSASYDTRNQEITKALVRIFNKTNVDFGILGKEEVCCGDFARRLGEDGLFEMLVEENYSSFKKYNVKSIVANSPHCYHTFKNEYPVLNKKLKINYNDMKAQHYSEFLAELVKQKKLKFNKALKKRVTFHDPCYLGRYNLIYDPPRDLLRSIPGIELVEMKSSKCKSICCGGGGGRMWLEATAEKRISTLRIKEALDVNAEIIATGCPFCLTNLEDAIKITDNEDKLEVKDIAELLDMSME